MARLMGRRPQGEWVIGCAPQGHCKTLTLVAALHNDGSRTYVNYIKNADYASK
jgi:hypothetical protein